jgi:hypothetical protein
MKRILGILAGAGLAVLIGCAQQYDLRLEATLANKKYQQTLDRNLEKAPDGSNLKPANIYVRPPLGFKGPAQTFALGALEPGRFNIADSFIDPDKQAGLHIVARDNRPKATPKKAAKPAEAEPPPAARGDFTADVLDLIKSAYSVDVDAQSLKSETKGHGSRMYPFKTATKDAGNKEVQVWIYGEKNSPTQVALIFDYPKESRNSLSSAIGHCLEAFGVGRWAESLYAGREEIVGEDGVAAPPGGVF